MAKVRVTKDEYSVESEEKSASLEEDVVRSASLEESPSIVGTKVPTAGPPNEGSVSGSESKSSRMTWTKWAFEGQRTEDGAIARWAALSRIFREPYKPASTDDESSSKPSGSSPEEIVQRQPFENEETRSEASMGSFEMSAITGPSCFDVEDRLRDYFIPDEVAGGPMEDGEGRLLPENDRRAFTTERAKWQAYFSGLQLATKIDENKDTDRTYKPFLLLFVGFLISLCNFLPLLAIGSTGRKPAWNVDSTIYVVVVAISLGACIPTLIELLNSSVLNLVGEFWKGEEPEGLLYLYLVRFLFVATHCVTYSIVLIMILNGQMQSRFYFYSFIVNQWYVSKVLIFVFFASVHMPHWPKWRYLLLFSVFSVTIGVMNYANVVVNYTSTIQRVFYPLVATTALAFIYFTYSLWAAIKAGKYRSLNGSLSVPAVVILLFELAITLVVLLELFVDSSIGAQRFVSYPLWKSCLGPVDRTLFIVLVSVTPIRLSRLLAQKTKRYLTTLAEVASIPTVVSHSGEGGGGMLDSSVDEAQTPTDMDDSVHTNRLHGLIERRARLIEDHL